MCFYARFVTFFLFFSSRLVFADGWGPRVDIPAGPEDLPADRESGGTGRHEEPAHAEAPARAGLPRLRAAGNGVRHRDRCGIDKYERVLRSNGAVIASDMMWIILEGFI